MSFGVDAYTTLFCQQPLWCGMKINTKQETSEVALNFLLKFIYVLITYFFVLIRWDNNLVRMKIVMFVLFGNNNKCKEELINNI